MMCVTDLILFLFFDVDRKGDTTFQIKINFKQEKYETEGVKAIRDVE